MRDPKRIYEFCNELATILAGRTQARDGVIMGRALFTVCQGVGLSSELKTLLIE